MKKNEMEKKNKNGKKKNEKMYILFGRGRITSQPSSDWFNSCDLIG
jgi:hypothetical protein